MKNKRVLYTNGITIHFIHQYDIIDNNDYLDLDYSLVHRTDGPAKIFPDGKKEYYLNGIYYPNIKSDEEWLIKQIIE
jgi:hypothetical protein